MSRYSSSLSTRTPGLVLGGVVVLAVTAALSLPFPLLGGLLLTPALLAAAITGYLNRPSSRFIALSASAAALLIALLSIVLIVVQPSGDLVFLSALHTLYGFFCFLCALVGTTMLWLGRHHELFRVNGTEATGSGPGARPAQGRFPNARDDLARVGGVAAQGARRAVVAWEAYQRVSEPRRQRAVARAERRERRRAEEREQQNRFQTAQRNKEDGEIHKAKLRQAREYNSKFWF